MRQRETEKGHSEKQSPIRLGVKDGSLFFDPTEAEITDFNGNRGG